MEDRICFFGLEQMASERGEHAAAGRRETALCVARPTVAHREIRTPYQVCVGCIVEP